MQWFYDGQIRRYIGQVIRMLSGFKYQAGDGKQITVPVIYGDMTRQVGQVIKDNSENKLPSAPRIAVYITGLAMDKTRLGDSTFVSKVHIREREFDEGTGEYTAKQGNNYTVERLMPTPYKLTLKADIWTTNTDMKLQIMEQILMLFNPSLEIQTTDNFLDWTSLSVVELTDITFSSRSIPVGNETEIDVGSLTFETPIWISAPTKVKKLGVVTDVLMNIFDATGNLTPDFVNNKPAAVEFNNVSGYGLLVYNNKLSLLKGREPLIEDDAADTVFTKIGADVSWNFIFEQYPGKFRTGVSQVFLTQDDGNQIVGTLSEDADDSTILHVNWDQDTFPTNTLIANAGNTVLRGSVDAIVDPTRFNPRPRLPGGTLDWPDMSNGPIRYIILESIGDTVNDDGPDGWKNQNGSDFYADANSIIEWNGTSWEVVLDPADPDLEGTPVYITNLRTGIQYKFLDGEWTKSFEGEYRKGYWRMIF
jgi:hypothetical protein